MTGEPHELCCIFPEMPDQEINELARDIAQVGLIDPVITYQGKILDGRNRFRACLMVDVSPRCEEWSGQAGSPLRFVVSRNLTRRNLKTEQRAAIAVKLKDRIAEDYRMRQVAGLKKGSREPESRLSNLGQTGADSLGESAAMMRVSRSYVADAQAIREASPTLFAAMEVAEVTVPAAKDIIADPDKLAAVNAGRAKPSDFSEKRSRKPADLSMAALVAAASKAAGTIYNRFGNSDDIAVCEAAHDIQQAVHEVIARLGEPVSA